MLAHSKNTRPALFYHLGTLQPKCEIRLKTIGEATGGAKVTITITAPDKATPEAVKVMAEQDQAVRIALRDAERETERLESEKASEPSSALPTPSGRL